MLSEVTSGLISTDVLEDISEESFTEEERQIRRKLGRIDSRSFLDKILKEATEHQNITPKDPRRSLIRESYYYGRRRMRHLSRHSAIRNTAVSLMSFRKKFFIFDRASLVTTKDVHLLATSAEVLHLETFPNTEDYYGTAFGGQMDLEVDYQRTNDPINHDFLAMADMCLCGLLSLDLSVHLICCVEVFFSMVLLIQAPDLLTSNGTYFYFLGTFDGSGIYFFTLHLIMCVSCVCTALLLYIGGKMKRPNLVITHLVWQLLFIAMTITLSIILLNLGRKGAMLMPSSIVLSIMLITPGLGELWWSYLTYCFYRQLKKRERKKKLSGTSSECMEIPQTEC